MFINLHICIYLIYMSVHQTVISISRFNHYWWISLSFRSLFLSFWGMKGTDGRAELGSEGQGFYRGASYLKNLLYITDVNILERVVRAWESSNAMKSVHLYLCSYVRMYVCPYVCMSLYLYVPMFVCPYFCMSLCLYVCMSLCLYVPMFVCPYVSMYVWHVLI